MKKILTVILNCLLFVFSLKADGIFFSSNGNLTRDCQELFDALNLPNYIVDAHSWSDYWCRDVLTFLKTNCWVDGEYKEARGNNVDFDKVIDFSEKLGVISHNLPGKNVYDYVVIMCDNAIEARLNCKLWTTLMQLNQNSRLLVNKSVIVFVNGQWLLSMWDGRWSFKMSDDGSLNSLVRYLYKLVIDTNKYPTEVVRISYCSVDPYCRNDFVRKAKMVDILQEVVNKHQIKGDILIITPSEYVSKKLEQIKNIVTSDDSSINSYEVVGYSVIQPSECVDMCQSVEVFSACFFDKLSELMEKEYNVMFPRTWLYY